MLNNGLAALEANEMSKSKICASLVVALFLCLQPFVYCQKSTAEPDELSVDPIIDSYGNLLFFKAVPLSGGIGTEVSLISGASGSLATATQTYPGIFSSIRRGAMAIYAIQSQTAASSNADTPNLIALVTGPGTLPNEISAQQPLSGFFQMLRIARAADGGADVIYIGESSNSGPVVQVLTYSGSDKFTLVGSTVPRF